MTDDLVKRLRRKVAKNKRTSIEVAILIGCEFIKEEAASRIEHLEYALRSIAETPIGAEIPDRTTIWGLAGYMRETATDALKEGNR
jgi:hypothetical protein